MPLIAQLIGGAGTGKTRELMACMEKAVSELHDPRLVGFVSFTRAACDEAADRAADMFDMRRSELRSDGWFKTLHGIAYRCLGIGDELLTDSKESRDWLAEALQDDVGRTANDDDTERADVFDGQSSDAAKALSLWSAARSRLEGLRPVWQRADDCDSRTPDFEACREIIERYEQAKRLGGRVDFVDIVGRFAGWGFSIEGACPREPDGELPNLEAWIHDEMQDSSRLLDAAFRRLISPDCVRWVYLGADPYQSIFGWAGADHRCFLDGYPAAKRRIMPKSWRCPSEILKLGEDVLRDCSDYWDRMIEPCRPGGEIEEADLCNGWADQVDPRESWLVLARTNFQANRLARRLNDLGIPWHPTKKDGGSPWKAPKRHLVITGLTTLQAGGWVDGREWKAIVESLPVKHDGTEVLVHGAKTEISGITAEDAVDRWPWLQPADLIAAGATQAGVDLITTGRWRGVIDRAEEHTAAIERWGWEAVKSPGVRLGTVHSAKGMEAENVALLTTISEPCIRATEADAGADEETRTKYVAVTRARNKLVVIRERHARYRWRLPL